MSSPTNERSGKLPLVVWVMSAGTFLMGTTEFVIAGLLPEMAGDLGVSVARTGLLITAFAVGMIVGAPLMAVATLRLPQRSTLVMALAIFSVGHVIAALSSSFTILLAARVVTALATGAFWSVGAVVATTAAGPAASSRALGVMNGGMTIANVIGVPLGAWAGQFIGWRGPFWVLAALSAAAVPAILRLMPAVERHEVPSIRAEFAALRQGRIWLALSAAALLMGGLMATYSYISPLLTERAGIPSGAVALVLVGFGVGALLGTTAGGRFGDRRPSATTLTGAALTALVLLLLVPLSTSAVATVILVVLMGMTGFTVVPVVTALAVRFGGSAPTLAAALTVSAFNTGTAVGSWAGGISLDSSLGQTGPALVGAVVATLTLVPLTVLALRRTPRTQESRLVRQGTDQEEGTAGDADTRRATV
ncbi:MFS transporter [Streptomyces sp. NPDC048254]|uniref:MFS transporter n=1 Tax=Streptomyces sp. NPDC048254 TaxID=3365525 RepID=UPI00371805A0